MKENKNSGISRRDFIGNTAKAAAVFTIVPGQVVSGFGFQAPSDKLNIACVGIGGMGASNLEALQSENIVALCDVDWDYSRPCFRYISQRQKVLGLAGNVTMK